MIVFRNRIAIIPTTKELDSHVSKRKLLLADDSVTIQKVVNLTFADEGIDVVAVGDGDTAMQRIMEDRPDVVLADVNMPGLSGYQICDILRENEATKHIPVILLVGSFEPFNEAEAARVGARSYLTKPFQSIRQLVAQVSELMASTAAPEPAPEQETEPVAVSTSDAEPTQAPIVDSTPAAESAPSPPSPYETTRLEAFREDRLASMGTETMYQQPVAQAADAVPPGHEVKAAEAEDIESLYQRSVAPETEPGAADSGFMDIGIDDEMIETSYATQDTDRIDLELEHRMEFPPTPEMIEEDLDSEILEYANVPTEASDEAASGVTSGIIGERIAEGQDETTEAKTIQLDPSVAAAMASETMPPIEQPPPSRTDDLSATFPTFPAGSETTGPLEIGEETVRMDSRFDTKGSEQFEFDELNLLEVPQTESGNTIEITTPVSAIEKGGSHQIVTLSPELIEMIAQRVVEKLSEKH